jgi:predicted HD phosphohydrolase
VWLGKSRVPEGAMSCEDWIKDPFGQDAMRWRVWISRSQFLNLP